MEFNISYHDAILASRLLSSVCKSTDDSIESKVLIEASDGKITFYGTNGNVILTFMALDFELKSEGTCMVTYSKLADFIGSVTPWDSANGCGVEFVSFRTVKKNDSEHIELKSRTASKTKTFTTKVLLHSFSAFGFMKPEPFVSSSFSMSSELYKSGVDKVAAVVNPNISLDFIRGVNLRIDDDFITFTGTDSVVLSEYRVKNADSLPPLNLHVPLDFIVTLKKAAYSDGEIFFSLSPSGVIGKFLNVEISSKLILGGDYPNCSPMFDMFTHSTEVDRASFSSGLKSVRGALDKDDNNRLTIEISGGKMRMYNDFSDVDLGDASDFTGDFVIDINGMLLMKAIDRLDKSSGNITLRFSHENGYFIVDPGEGTNQRVLISSVRRRS